jgi:hypothetical protein
MRVRHAALAGSAVAAMSLATTVMASVQASASVHTAAAPVHATTATATSVGSAAGLLLGLLVVLAVAAVSFMLRLRVAGPEARRTLVLPEARVTAQPVAAVSWSVALAD